MSRLSPFWQAVVGTVVGGLILAAIIALVGIVSRASEATVILAAMGLSYVALLVGGTLATGSDKLNPWPKEVEDRLERLERDVEALRGRTTARPG